MNSEFISPSDSGRIKRITRSNTKSKLERKPEPQSQRKSTAKAEGPRAKKTKLSAEGRALPPVFSGAALMPAELQQLLKKFRTDGHFRLNKSPSKSPAPLVVSRTTDGKVVTTKIECYKQKRFFMRELAATMISPKTENEEPGNDDASAVVFTSKLPDTPEKPFTINKSDELYFSSTQETSQQQRPGNYTYPESFSNVSNSEDNVPEIPSYSSAFAFVTPAQWNPIAWNSSQPPDNNALVENKNPLTTSGSYYPGSGISQYGYNESAENRLMNGNHSNLDPLSLPTIDDRHGNDPNFIFLKPEFPVLNQSCVENSFMDWNSIDPLSLNTAVANSASTISNIFNNVCQSDNSMNFMPPSMSAQNTRSMYDSISQINNGLARNDSYSRGYSCASSFASWNDVEVIPHDYLKSGDSSAYYSMYEMQNSAGLYVPTSSAANVQINSCLQNQQNNERFYLLNGNQRYEPSTRPAHVFNDYDGPFIRNFLEIRNIDNDLTTSNGQQSANELFQGFRDIQYNCFNPSASQDCNNYEYITGDMLND